MNESISSTGEVERLPVREWVASKLQIHQYAEASGDYNPIHLDDQYAIAAGLGGTIAHGMLTMAQLAALVTDWIGDRGSILRLSVRFEGMVRPGERVRFTGFVRDRQGDELECQLEAIKDTEEKVLSGSALVRLQI